MTETLTGQLAAVFGDVIATVDGQIGENRSYGAGIGPHDEDDQVDALVRTAREAGALDGLTSVATVNSDPSAVSYPDGRAADLVLRGDDRTEYCEAKLLRFQRSTGDPSPEGFAKVFSPFQDGTLVTDVDKLAGADIRAGKTFLGLFYRPVSGPGTEITPDAMAGAFVDAVDRWTAHEVALDAVVPFDGLQHPTHQRGAILVWSLTDQPERFF